MAKHTLGPWGRNIKPATKYNTIFAGRNTHICHLTTMGLSAEEVEANCNLIVAAPELLAALMGLINICTHPQATKKQMKTIAEEARAAIAKAKGEQE